MFCTKYFLNVLIIIMAIITTTIVVEDRSTQHLFRFFISMHMLIAYSVMRVPGLSLTQKSFDEMSLQVLNAGRELNARQIWSFEGFFQQLSLEDTLSPLCCQNSFPEET